MARKRNTKAVQLDKGSHFFASKCGVCHPGNGSLKYDRDGEVYFDASQPDGKRWGYERRGKTAADVLTAGVNIDGDYANVNPATGLAVKAPWDKTGVAEADCLMCHMPGYSWSSRAALLGAGAALAPLPAFAAAPAAGLGFADVTLCKAPDPCFNPFPPVAKSAALNYASAAAIKPDGKTPLTPATIGDFLVKSPPDENCRGCHTTPDLRKSGRSWAADTDVHKAAGVGCTACHPGGSSAKDKRISRREQHDFGKGDITIGSARDDLDNTGLSCAGCHLAGAAAAGAPDPTEAHGSIPPVHFEKMACQVCHIRYLQDSPGTPRPETPDLFIDMATSGKQLVQNAARFTRSDPVDPARHDPALLAAAACANPADPATCKHPEYLYRWYPGVRPWRGKLTTVKPLLTSWVGDWLDGRGAKARVRPVPLRLARRAIQVDASGSPADAGGVFVNATIEAARKAKPEAFDMKWNAEAKAVNGLVNTREELEAYLRGVAGARDQSGDPIFIGTPVIVRAGKVWHLDKRGKLQSFESPVAESHDFAVNHNVVPRRDAADPVAKPGPWGAGGCAECHSAGSPFFRAKQLADPQDVKGQPVFHEHWELMGYSPKRVAKLTAGVPGKAPQRR